MEIKFGSVTIDALDAAALAQFYGKLLNLEVVDYGGGYYSVGGAAGNILIQQDDDYLPPVWPSVAGKQQIMMHLDLVVKNVDEAIDFALHLGAIGCEEQFGKRDGKWMWYTMLDPAGHPFCLCGEE